MYILSDGTKINDVERVRELQDDISNIDEVFWEDLKEENGEKCFEVGYYYYNSMNIPYNYEKAYDWLLLAAEFNSARSFILLAEMKYKGIGTNKQMTLAFKWYRRAAIIADSRAYFPLGYMSARGIGTYQNYNKASFWFLKGVDAGDIRAQNALNNIFQ